MHDKGIDDRGRMDKTITVILTDAQGTQLLGKLMSEISETCWASGWFRGVEDDLPRIIAMAAATRDKQEWGKLFVWPDDADLIIALVTALGHWATPSDDDLVYLPYQPKGDF